MQRQQRASGKPIGGRLGVWHHRRMDRSSPANEGVGAYVAWKGWGPGFGTLARGDAAHFTRELRDVVKGKSIRRVLEVGYGNGVFLAYARSNGWQVTGTEIQPELVDLAIDAGYDVRHADELTSLPDGEFDIVVAFDVFEHIDAYASIDFLRELGNKLTPDGSIVLRFPNADSWIGNPFQHGDVTHVNALGVLKVGYYARESGLEIARLRAGTRRGFEASVIHGLHKYTAGVLIKIIAGVAKALYFPDLPVVLSGSSVVCVLRRAPADG
jgi:SAM-dependent methyltransferase